MGSDAPLITADGRPGENYFVDNEVLSTEMGVKIKEADNTVITGESILSFPDIKLLGTLELLFSPRAWGPWSIAFSPCLGEYLAPRTRMNRGVWNLII